MPPSSPTMVGSAVETIVWSSEASSMPDHEPAQHDHDLAVGERFGHRGSSWFVRAWGRLGVVVEGSSVEVVGEAFEEADEGATVRGRPVADGGAERGGPVVEDRREDVLALPA